MNLLLTRSSYALIHQMVALAVILITFATPPSGQAQGLAEPTQDTINNKVTTWLGNTYGGTWNGVPSTKGKEFGNRRGHVPMGIDAIAVADNGTVFTKARQDEESHKQFGIFDKDGNDQGQFGWASTAVYDLEADPAITWARTAPSIKTAQGNAIAVSSDNDSKYVVMESSILLKESGKKEKKVFGYLRAYYRAADGQYQSLTYARTSHGKEEVVSVGQEVEGLALSGGKLYVSVDNEGTDDDKVLIYEVSDDEDVFAKTLLGGDPSDYQEISFENPGRLTVDGAGNLWIIRTSDQHIYKYNTQEERLTQKIVLPADGIPTDVQYNDSQGNDYAGLLMVTDNGLDINVKFYDPAKVGPTEATDTTEWERTFGEQGGIYSGIPGVYSEKKFRRSLTGVDNDAAGNLYVSITGKQRSNHGVSLYKFGPSGELAWQRHNLAFIDVGVIDPRSAEEEDVYTEHYHYKVKYGEGFQGNQARGWEIAGYTMDTSRYDDVRGYETKASQSMAPMKIVYAGEQQDQKLFFYAHQKGEMLAVFRPSDDGEILKPCVLLSNGTRPTALPLPDEYYLGDTKRPWFWVDKNGDGKMDGQNNEFSRWENANYLEGRAWHVDDQGHIWWVTSASGENNIKRLKLRLNEGAPVYELDTTSNTAVERYSTPAPFTDIKRIFYDDAEDVMYLTGYTKNFRDTEALGNAAGRVLAKFSGWSTDNRQLEWRVDDLRYQGGTDERFVHNNLFIQSLDVAGDYVFLGHNGGQLDAENNNKTTIPNTRPTEIYRKDSGTYVGHLRSRPEANHGKGLLDMMYGTRAYQRQNGQYVIFEEEVWFGNVLVHQWNPEPLVSSGKPDLVVTALDWEPSSAQAGEAVRFRATVANQGEAPTPAGDILGAAFRVDGTLVAWSDTSTASLAAGESRVLTANGGPNGGDGTWSFDPEADSVLAHVDDVRRLAESNNRNNQRTVALRVAEAASLVAVSREVPSPRARSLEEGYWADLPATRFTDLTGQSEPSDNQVRFKTLWNEQHLVIGVEVQDREPLGGEDLPWRNDAIDLLLDPRNTQDTVWNHRAGHRQLVMDVFRQQYSSPQGFSSASAPHLVVADDSTGYFWEVRIPWAALDTTPQAGLRMGLDIANHDRDANDKQQFTYTQRHENFRNPSQFAALVLTEGDEASTTASRLQPLATAAGRSLTVYPNPSAGATSLRLSGFGAAQVQITDAQGQVVYRGAHRESQIEIAQHFPRGLYAVRVTDARGTLTEKLIIE